MQSTSLRLCVRDCQTERRWSGDYNQMHGSIKSSVVLVRLICVIWARAPTESAGEGSIEIEKILLIIF